jgi:hypothetical protein
MQIFDEKVAKYYFDVTERCYNYSVSNHFQFLYFFTCKFSMKKERKIILTSRNAATIILSPIIFNFQFSITLAVGYIYPRRF